MWVLCVRRGGSFRCVINKMVQWEFFVEKFFLRSGQLVAVWPTYYFFVGLVLFGNPRLYIFKVFILTFFFCGGVRPFFGGGRLRRNNCKLFYKAV